MELSNRKLQYIDGILERYGESTVPRFAYAVSRNRILLQPIVTSLNKAKQPSGEFREVEKRREGILQQFARKDALGSPTCTRTQLPSGEVRVDYQVDDIDGYHQALLVLTEEPEVKAVVAAEEARIIEYEKLLDAETEVNPYPIRMSDAPKDLITGNEMVLLLQTGFLVWDLSEENTEDKSVSK